MPRPKLPPPPPIPVFINETNNAQLNNNEFLKNQNYQPNLEYNNTKMEEDRYSISHKFADFDDDDYEEEEEEILE